MSIKLPADLWESFVSGNHSCFGDLFKSYYKGLYGYGLKLCNDSGLVEDCIQNIFISVWERRFDLTHVNSPNVYLYVALRRNLLKDLKRKKRGREFPQITQIGFNIMIGEEDIIIMRETEKVKKVELAKALNQLTDKQKEVIVLHYYNGMSFREIEDILSINRQSVKNLMYRAMESLRSKLNIDVMRLVISLVAAFLFTL